MTYTPDADYNGPDSTPGNALTSPAAVVSLTITPVNDAPVAMDDVYVTDEDKVLSVPLQGVLMKVSGMDAELLYGAGPTLYADFGAGEGLFAYDGMAWSFVSAMDAEGYRSLVSMDRMPDGDLSEKPADTKATERQNSWLMELLLEGGVRAYNPFEPTEKIQVTIGGRKERT